ncbi:hypothetical protein [Nocardia otitidiscaviarum]|uniref:hypothetical protein n=1 Tax=Nocardia otitidiscaviarum TaxID=1823 RepID=UPI0024558184|nr:hypothetical protein [Nocardia otitidiscaviarum]
MSSRFHDPDGHRYGLPTYPWRSAPAHLRTRRQLAQDNRRPGDEYQAQVLRPSRWGLLKAYLYDEATAKPKREVSDAQREALRIARWVRSARACEDRGIDASDMRHTIAQARADLAARRTARTGREHPDGRDRRRSR